MSGSARKLAVVSGYRRRGSTYRPRAPERALPGTGQERHVRAPWSLPAFATAVTFAFLAVSAVAAVSTTGSGVAALPGPRSFDAGPGQGYVVADAAHPGAGRDDFAVSRYSTAPAVGIPDPGTAQAIAYEMVLARGWDQGEYECLVALWTRESNWNVYAHNPSSGAYGIPQSLPGEKMASAGADWATNPATQITWGLGYIAARYGTPCGAWEHSERKGWY